MEVFQLATDRGVIIVNCTQCLQGKVKMGAYEAGSGLSKAGVISGYDMTDEAVLTKLFYLLSIPSLSVSEVKHYMAQNLKGEVTLTEV